MKSILYIGATLMVGASIYGFVDYQQTRQKKEFRDMYAEEKKTAANVPAAEVPVKTEARTPVAEKKAPKTKKARPAKENEPEPVISPAEKAITSVPAIPEEKLEQPVPSKENKLVKKKKIRKEFFSRGRMPEEEILVEKVKTEPAKKTTKE